MNLATLFYVYDPMCSWCWGYKPTWSLLENQLKQQFPDLAIEYRLGGLAADTDEPMPQDMQVFLQQTWQRISVQLGTQFNFDFWTECQPKRATYPACRAILLARDAGLEAEFYLAVQQAYYLEAKNPSDDTTLVDIASKLAMDREAFAKALNSDLTKSRLQQEISQTRRLPIQGFPSLVLALNGDLILIELDYKNAPTSFNQIALLMKEAKLEV
ncbi:DsbA family protein [Shewanella sp. Choline-02u-19]|uniref:DsbA family protein n=1 Tax=unclassified Shewanella TaxID=196818 RepID=UPI000C341F6D|nr:MULTISPECIES: DsbA family protein [unclassified Shewanella]PKG56904.1 DsbA family protein [Shewanella sp. GutDb-MelDb]PKG74401.1 DsbA family protein [Shewanella sp. GutCb]PKH57773.1 DsbA family protein [Shewanella sp. Bg11-22]PKI29808.1 DsbA family protein [Shewanella sp. Choline-02u-19]